MTSRVTDCDRATAAAIKRIRLEAKLTQPQVAAHLGITYQSYQKMEGGKHSFRVHTICKLATLYNLPITDILNGGDGPSIHPVTAACHYLLSQMDQPDIGRAFQCLRSIKNEATQ